MIILGLITCAILWYGMLNVVKSTSLDLHELEEWVNELNKTLLDQRRIIDELRREVELNAKAIDMTYELANNTANKLDDLTHK